MSAFISLASLADVDPAAGIKSYGPPFNVDKVVQMAMTVSTSNPGFNGLEVMDYVTRVTGTLPTDVYMAGYNAVEKKNKIIVEAPPAAPTKPVNEFIFKPEVILDSSRIVAPEPTQKPLTTLITNFPPQLPSQPIKPTSPAIWNQQIATPIASETFLQMIERKTGLTTKQTTAAGLGLLALAAVVGFVKGKNQNS